MRKAQKLQTIQFHNQSLFAIQKNNTIYIAIKPICENMGLDWSSQVKKIKSNSVLNSVMVIITTTGNDNKKYRMLTLPLEMLYGWLFSIHENRVKPEVKENLITYKKECYKVLFNHFNNTKSKTTKPKLVENTTALERKNLREAVYFLVTTKNLSFPLCYKLIHEKFNVEHIDELDSQEVLEATAYIHSLICDTKPSTAYKERVYKESTVIEDDLITAASELKRCKMTEEEFERIVKILYLSMKL